MKKHGGCSSSAFHYTSALIENTFFFDFTSVFSNSLHTLLKSLFSIILICLLIFFILILFNIKSQNENDDRTFNLIKMYKNKNCSVYVSIGAGLGNRLMSFVGIIVISIYLESKPFCILFNNVS